MTNYRIQSVAVILGFLLAFSAAEGKFTIVPVSKESKIAKELEFTIKVTPNTEQSGLEGTTTFEIRAPKNAKLENLSRIILRTHGGKTLTGRLPLELQRGKAGEMVCHFQLAPGIARSSILELVCPSPGEPNGVIYEVDLSTYVNRPD